MNRPVCNNLINSGGASGPLFSYKHPLNQVGNVMSISAVAGWNGRLVYGDFTTGQIFSLAPDGTDQRLIQGDSSECVGCMGCTGATARARGAAARALRDCRQ